MSSVLSSLSALPPTLHFSLPCFFPFLKTNYLEDNRFTTLCQFLPYMQSCDEARVHSVPRSAASLHPASRCLQTRLQDLIVLPPGPYRPVSRCLKTCLQVLTDPPPGSSSSRHSFPRGDVYMGLPWSSVLKTPDEGDAGSIPGWGRSPGEGNGSPFSNPAWRIPRTEEPGGLQSAGLRRAGHS